jgi:hypothetical protein
MISNALPMRLRWSRSSGVWILTLAVCVLWACLLAAQFFGPAPAKPLVLDRGQLTGVQGLLVVSETPLFNNVEVVYAHGDDVRIEQRGDQLAPPSWSIKGSNLVLTLNEENRGVQVALPTWINTLEAESLWVSTARSLRLENLSARMVSGAIEGSIATLKVTMGHPLCLSEPADSTRRHHTVKIETQATARLRVDAAAGSLSLPAVGAIQAIDIHAAPGVGLELDDLNQLDRIRVTPLDEASLKTRVWVSDFCERQRAHEARVAGR